MEQDFIRRFSEVRERPSPELLAGLLHPDAVLYQSHTAPIRGRAAALVEFRRLFRWLPGLRGEVERHAGHDGQMKFPIGARGTSIKAVDRFVLRDGLGIERAVYFDQLRLLTAVLLHPRVWPGFLRYRADRG